MMTIDRFKEWLGVELDPVGLREKFVAGLGGFFGIFLVLLITHRVLGLSGSLMFIGSMAATTVLLFAVPHGALSQPWPVLAGHGFSAVIGVCCFRWIPDFVTAAACAVGLSILVMHQLKCIHPPGGATALTAVLGGPAVHDLGFSYILVPVLLNAVILLLLAVLFNYPFPWRRYPASWQRKPAPVQAAGQVTHQDVISALERIETFVDITEDDLLRLHDILTRQVEERRQRQRRLVS